MKDIFTNGKTLILACDQGFEHGPIDFNETNIDSEYIFDIAKEGKFNAIAVQAGLAKHYYSEKYKDIPLIVKLNGKTRFDNEDPLSLQHTSVDYAVKLGASAVGYTIYLGSVHEQQMFKEFAKICEEAHKFGIQSVCWMYPRGKYIKDDLDTDVLAYAARIAHELGADVVKLKFNGDVEAMKWVVKSAGKTKVVFAGGSKIKEDEFLEVAKQMVESGACGMAVGRNVWQSDKPLKMAAGLRQIFGL
ncbi:MAG: class I fructose-bisphosphate aldolase [Candidatus Woesearchaeota archaeon]